MMGIVIRVKATFGSTVFPLTGLVRPTLLYNPDVEHELYY